MAMQAPVRHSPARDTTRRGPRAVERSAVVNPNGPSPQARALHAFCRNLVRPAVTVMPLTKTGVRGAFMIDLLAGFRPQPTGITVEHLRMPGYRVEIVRDKRSCKPIAEGAVLYLHGGGIRLLRAQHPPADRRGDRAAHRAPGGQRRVPGRCRRRRSPDRYATVSAPTPGCSSRASIRARWSSRVIPRRVPRVRDGVPALDVGLPAPAGIVGISALLDLDVTAKLEHPNVRRDTYVVAAGLATICRMGGEVEGRVDPLLSPVNGALAEFPPSFLLAAEDEVLRCDSELMAQRLRAAGVDTTLQIWRGQVHAFPALAPGLPESRIALAHISRFICSRIAAGRVRPGKIA